MSKMWLHGNLQKDKTTTIIMIKIPQTKIRTIMMKKKTKTKKIRLKMIMKMTIKIIKTMITQKKKKYQKNLQLKRKLIQRIRTAILKVKRKEVNQKKRVQLSNNRARLRLLQKLRLQCRKMMEDLMKQQHQFSKQRTLKLSLKKLRQLSTCRTTRIQKNLLDSISMNLSKRLKTSQPKAKKCLILS